MSITTKQTIADIREALGSPGAILGNATIVMKMQRQARVLLARIGITDVNEAFKRTTITANANQTEYAINAERWGAPFMVETWDGGADPNFVPVEITIAPIQDRDRFQAFTGYPGLVLSERVISFFTESGQAKAAIQPVPTESALYRVYYEDESISLAYDDNPVGLKDRFNPLLVVKTALSCLPDTDHEETKYARILAQLKSEEVELDRLFMHQVFQLNPSDNSVSYFGADRELGDWLI